jgi:hypothetical protein
MLIEDASPPSEVIAPAIAAERAVPYPNCVVAVLNISNALIVLGSIIRPPESNP